MRYAIGIDPGVKTGFAVWSSEGKFVEISTLNIYTAIKRVLEYNKDYNVVLVIENPNTWIGFNKGDKGSTSRLQGAGSIKRDYSVWETFANEESIQIYPVKLTQNLKKIDAKIFHRYTGWGKQTSVHSRDAAMMVLDFNFNIADMCL
jgi:hypothetical protein